MSKRKRSTAPPRSLCVLGMLLHDNWRVLIAEHLTTADTLCLMDAYPEVRRAVTWPGKPRHCNESTRQLYASGRHNQIWFFRKHLHGLMSPTDAWIGYLRHPRFSGAAENTRYWVDVALPRAIPAGAYPAVVDHLLANEPVGQSVSAFFSLWSGLRFERLLRFPELVQRLLDAWASHQRMDVLLAMRRAWRSVAYESVREAVNSMPLGRQTCKPVVACIAHLVHLLECGTMPLTLDEKPAFLCTIYFPWTHRHAH